jgi:alpha-1,3-mannosyltransferase
MLSDAKRAGRSLRSWLDQSFPRIVVGLMVADLLVAAAVLRLVPYTEIDWRAYMQEVAGVIEGGQYDYAKLRGDTGPLVYPAGFVYAYSLLFFLTDRGADVRAAQVIFAGLHATCFGVVACIYRLYAKDHRVRNARPALPPLAIVALLASRRVMSLFVLRLFNDALQSLLMYASIVLFAHNRWSLGCLVFSASVSVKMNALLYAPALAVLLCQALGPVQALVHAAGVCGGLQLLLGAPFLAHAPVSYVSRAFEFSRVFVHKWSVNGAFLSESRFVDPRLSVALLGCHLLVLLLFGHFRWTEASRGGLPGLVGVRRSQCGDEGGALSWRSWAARSEPRRLRASHTIHCMFTCNLIGIAFARTLHYQFYLWYFHTLPLLAFTSTLPPILGCAILAAVEVAFNVYPPRGAAALTLCACHLALLAGLWGLPPVRGADIYECPTDRGEKQP